VWASIEGSDPCLARSFFYSRTRALRCKDQPVGRLWHPGPLRRQRPHAGAGSESSAASTAPAREGISHGVTPFLRILKKSLGVDVAFSEPLAGPR